MDVSLFSNVFLPATLAIITLGLGLSLTFDDIKNVALYPRGVVIGLLSQMILLPLIAFSIALVTKLPPVYSVGLVIISVCPGGATSNLVNYIIRGNVALSLSITIVHGLITVVKIPLIVRLALHIFMRQDTEIHLPLMNTIFQIFVLTIIPATAGILIRAWKEKLAERLENPLRFILPVLLLTVYAGVMFIEKGGSGSDLHKFLYLIPFTLALNLLSMFSGYYVPRLFKLSKRNQFTIAVEVGLQNSSLAIFVAGTLLSNYNMALVAVVYGSFSFFTTWLFGYLAREYF